MSRANECGMNVKVREHSRNICPLSQTKLAAVSRDKNGNRKRVFLRAAEKVVFDREADTLLMS